MHCEEKKNLIRNSMLSDPLDERTCSVQKKKDTVSSDIWIWFHAYWSISMLLPTFSEQWCSLHHRFWSMSSVPLVVSIIDTAPWNRTVVGFFLLPLISIGCFSDYHEWHYKSSFQHIQRNVIWIVFYMAGGHGQHIEVVHQKLVEPDLQQWCYDVVCIYMKNGGSWSGGLCSLVTTIPIAPE